MVSLLFRRSREGGVRGLARDWACVRRGDVPATAVTGAVRRLDVRVVRVRHGSRLGSACGGIKKKLSAAWCVHQEEFISFSEYPLSAQVACSRLLTTFEQHWGIL